MVRAEVALKCRNSSRSRDSEEGAGLRASAAWGGGSVVAAGLRLRVRGAHLPCAAFCCNMELSAARQAILQLLHTVAPADRPALLEWMRTSRDFDEFTHDNNDSMLKSIAEDLRNCLPLETMLSSEHLALQKVLHADICTQDSLLQNADVIIMNNVFEYFLDEAEQARAWECISHNVRKQGSLLVTVPSLEESLSGLQVSIQLSSWVEEVPLNYDVYPEKDINREALEQIHLYKIL
uniref:Uncharacterized protein n=1 Tax=Myotis myotis TaxID=51298 RepID=A0A7J8AN71_MYOMY|nr:hypothetical protein mMyoMyo1_008032 [Myotis myotis]